MKKFFLLLAAISISYGAMSQKGKVTSALNFIDQGLLDKAKEAVDQAMVHEKSKDWFNTYFAQGSLCIASYESENAEFNAFYPDPLEEAYAAYKKALELDPKNTVQKRIITSMIYNTLAADLYSQGSKRFDDEDFEGALKSFKLQIEISEGDKYVGVLDTGMYYNAGLAAFNSGKFTESIEYFEKCAEMKYLGIKPYFQVYESYLGLGDTVKAESVLMGLTDVFPGDKSITLNLIDLYMNSNKLDEALKYLKVAKEIDPSNSRLYFAEGIIYLNQFKYDEAIAQLKESVELNTDLSDTQYLFDMQYGLGASYINKASDMFNEANEIMDVNEYNAAVDVANGVFEEALPYMERANELMPDDIFTMRSLKELYYRLKQKNPSLSSKYDAMEAKINALENQ